MISGSVKALYLINLIIFFLEKTATISFFYKQLRIIHMTFGFGLAKSGFLERTSSLPALFDVWSRPLKT